MRAPALARFERARTVGPTMPRITYRSDGSTHEVPAGTRYLDFCRRAETPQDFGCTVGSCGTCILVLVEGRENVSPPSEDELETVTMCTDADARLGCQLVVLGDIVIEHPD